MKWTRFLFLLLPSILLAAEGPQEIPLWPNGAPGFEERRNEPIRAESYWVRNVHNPSVTVFLPPKEKATGAAVLICPGGGHRELVFNAEGVEPAKFLNSIGVAAFALKYRLARETNSPYALQKHPREDAERAMRLIRSRAGEWGIDPKRVGVMGFSAGGEVASMIAYGDGKGEASAADPVDRLNSRPDFQILIYPGPLGAPDTVSSNAPPAFFLTAGDDRGPARVITGLLQKYREARAPVEAHILAQGGHAFNMGTRSKLAAVRGWPQRLADWMADSNLLKAPDAATPAQ